MKRFIVVWRWFWPSLLVGLALEGFFQVSLSRAVQTFSHAQPEMFIGQIYGNRTVGQTFVTEKTGLAAIALKMANYRPPNQPDRPDRGPVILHLQRSPLAPDDLALVSRSADAIVDHTYVEFAFPPLTQIPAGTPLYFWIEAPEARLDNAVTLYAAYAPASYPDGTLVLNHWPIGTTLHDMVFNTTYKPARGPAVQEMFQEWAGQRPGMWGQWEWYQILGELFLAGLWGLGLFISLGLRP